MAKLADKITISFQGENGNPPAAYLREIPPARSDPQAFARSSSPSQRGPYFPFTKKRWALAIGLYPELSSVALLRHVACLDQNRWPDSPEYAAPVVQTYPCS